jgi:catechol 2,3-dioxygenase-like lactoylglutathione lyase family enzyme
MIILSTDDLDESIRFYSETLGMTVKFRDGAHFAVGRTGDPGAGDRHRPSDSRAGGRGHQDRRCRRRCEGH